MVGPVELIEQRSNGGISDHREGVDPLIGHGLPHVSWVEVTRIVREDERGSLADHDEAGPLSGTVHQWRQQQDLETHAIAGSEFEGLIGAHELPASDLSPTHGGHEDVVVPPQHALGHSGGSAGVEDIEVVRARFDRGSGGIR